LRNGINELSQIVEFIQVAFKYDAIVPWGRSFDEYRRMFRLTDQDLRLKILGCADGPASFNAAMFKRGYSAISCDPLYQFTSAQIQARIDATYEGVMRQTLANLDLFVWESISTPSELGRLRVEAMNEFMADYDQKKHEGRYVAAELPELPFASASFDLAVCSHFLFLYSSNLSLEFHGQAIESMCRVAKEVRIFPLLTYNAQPSSFVEPLMERLQNAGRQVSVEVVPYEFQRGGNKMMKIV
jgi:hypothetical protein